ncbi:MAG: ornithine carbamoyltransferase [Pseudomonadota bacterium]
MTTPRHFLDLDEVAREDLRAILDDAAKVKAARNGLPKLTPDAEQPLANHIVALIFEKPSTRTRISFDVGIRQMGGQTMVLSGNELQLGHGETVADTAAVLSRFVDAVMIRTFQDTTLRELAENATIPVVNGLTNRSHPCQIMADILTFEEKVGPIKGARIAWFGDGNNVCHSWIQAAAAFGFEMRVAGPETLEPDAAIVEAAEAAGATVRVERDAACAAQSADAIVTDAWLSMHDDVTSRDRRHNQLKPYQVTDNVMETAADHAIFLHCLPAHREEEVTGSVFDGPRSAVFDEAENRLHVQKGILRWCLSR